VLKLVVGALVGAMEPLGGGRTVIWVVVKGIVLPWAFVVVTTTISKDVRGLGVSDGGGGLPGEGLAGGSWLAAVEGFGDPEVEDDGAEEPAVVLAEADVDTFMLVVDATILLIVLVTQSK
jgi:hypothetical protein